MVSVDLLRNRRGLGLFFKYLSYKKRFALDHPDYFYPEGLCVFIGHQGNGKTLSAVNYVYGLMQTYPKCLLVTNLELRDYPFDGQRVFPFYDNDDFAKYNNGENGVIFLVDEIQLYLNSLESKNINLDVVQQICQQRKQRKHIVSTSQVFGRLAKPLREQFDTLIFCDSRLGCWQRNFVVRQQDVTGGDGMDNIEGKIFAKIGYWRTPEMFSRYDTSFVIKRGFVGAEKKVKGVFDDGSGRIVVAGCPAPAGDHGRGSSGRGAGRRDW